MKNFSFDYYSFLYNTSDTLLKNCGFSPDFFSKISHNIYLLGKNNGNIKKIRSENDMVSLQLKRRRENFERKKIYEAEDKDTFNKILILDAMTIPIKVYVIFLPLLQYLLRNVWRKKIKIIVK